MPDETVSGAETARRSGIPGEVVVEKMGVREKCICSPEEDYATDMYAAAEDALNDAALDRSDLDFVALTHVKQLVPRPPD